MRGRHLRHGVRAPLPSHALVCFACPAPTWRLSSAIALQQAHASFTHRAVECVRVSLDALALFPSLDRTSTLGVYCSTKEAFARDFLFYKRGIRTSCAFVSLAVPIGRFCSALGRTIGCCTTGATASKPATAPHAAPNATQLFASTTTRGASGSAVESITTMQDTGVSGQRSAINGSNAGNSTGGGNDTYSTTGIVVAVVVFAFCAVGAGVALIWRYLWRRSKDAVLRRHTHIRSERPQHAANHVDNPEFRADSILPATPGYVEDSSIQVNQGPVKYATPVNTRTQPSVGVGDARYGVPLTTATADPTYSQPLDVEAGSAHYAATPLTTADEVTGSAGYGTLLTTADSTYATPHDTSQV